MFYKIMWLSTFLWTWLPCTYIVMTIIHIVITMLLEDHVTLSYNNGLEWVGSGTDWVWNIFCNHYDNFTKYS